MSDSRSFVVDGTPPVASFTAAPSPVAVDPGATFAFRASDRSPAAFECRLSRMDGATEAPTGLSGALGALSEWEACSSPAEVTMPQRNGSDYALNPACVVVSALNELISTATGE